MIAPPIFNRILSLGTQKLDSLRPRLRSTSTRSADAPWLRPPTVIASLRLKQPGGEDTCMPSVQGLLGLLDKKWKRKRYSG
jgi:hypothetical protein